MYYKSPEISNFSSKKMTINDGTCRLFKILDSNLAYIEIMKYTCFWKYKVPLIWFACMYVNGLWVYW